MRWFDLISLIVGASLIWFAISGHDDAVKTLVPVIAGVAATMLGFLVTALSILMTLSSHRLIENMRRTGHLKRMVRGFFNSGLGFLGALIVSLISLMLTKSELDWIGILSMECLFFALYFFIIGGRSFYLVIEHLSSNSGEPQ